MLLIGYLTVRNQGKQRETVEVTREEGEEGEDGRIRVTTKIETKYVDPFSALGRLLKLYIPGLQVGSNS
jgi:hypothetical protein